MNKIITIILLFITLGGFSQNFFFNQHAGDNIIDEDTYLSIFFDNSGSMGVTLDSLEKMNNTILQDSLLQYYNNDETLYSERVIVLPFNGERFLSESALGAGISTMISDTSKIINIVFQDEAAYGYYKDFSPITLLGDDYITDINYLRGVTEPYMGTYKYTGIIFAVVGNADFDNFVNMVFNTGAVPYNTYNLIDKSDQFVYYLSIQDGGIPAYYCTLIMQALRDLGFNL